MFLSHLHARNLEAPASSDAVRVAALGLQGRDFPRPHFGSSAPRAHHTRQQHTRREQHSAQGTNQQPGQRLPARARHRVHSAEWLGSRRRSGFRGDAAVEGPDVASKALLRSGGSAVLSAPGVCMNDYYNDSGQQKTTDGIERRGSRYLLSHLNLLLRDGCLQAIVQVFQHWHIAQGHVHGSLLPQVLVPIGGPITSTGAVSGTSLTASASGAITGGVITGTSLSLGQARLDRVRLRQRVLSRELN